MSKSFTFFSIVFFLFCILYADDTKKSEIYIFSLENVKDLQLINVKAESVNHQGKKGIRVTKKEETTEGETLVIIPGVDFINGTIEIELAGKPDPKAHPQSRGFVGVAFRLDPNDISKYECFYVRPTNGRAEEQIQRNHSIQYIAHPDYPWYRMRQENPGVYESYVDLVPNDWTKIKIEVSGQKAKFYVHGADQPSLIVNDLKHGESEGKIALWLHTSTIAHFRNLIITPEKK